MADEHHESEWGSVIKTMYVDPTAPRIITELDRGGICFPSTCCKDPYTKKIARGRSYLYIMEGAIEENIYSPKVICGCIAAPCGQGQDNVFKTYFDHKPFLPTAKQLFATEKDINYCCYIPMAFEGFDCSSWYDLCTKPCTGGMVSIVKPKPNFVTCVDDNEWFKMATRQWAPCIPCGSCFGPVCCTVPLMVFLKDSKAAAGALAKVVPEALERKKAAPKNQQMGRPVAV